MSRSDKHKDRSANDQCYRRGNDIESRLRYGREKYEPVENHSGAAKRIDDAERQITPLSFVEGFERVNARLLKLRVDQALEQLRAERARLRSENDSAITFAEII